MIAEVPFMVIGTSSELSIEALRVSGRLYSQEQQSDVVPVQDGVQWSEEDALSASQLKQARPTRKLDPAVGGLEPPPLNQRPGCLPYSNKFEDFRHQHYSLPEQSLVFLYSYQAFSYYSAGRNIMESSNPDNFFETEYDSFPVPAPRQISDISLQCQPGSERAQSSEII